MVLLHGSVPFKAPHTIYGSPMIPIFADLSYFRNSLRLLQVLRLTIVSAQATVKCKTSSTEIQPGICGHLSAYPESG